MDGMEERLPMESSVFLVNENVSIEKKSEGSPEKEKVIPCEPRFNEEKSLLDFGGWYECSGSSAVINWSLYPKVKEVWMDYAYLEGVNRHILDEILDHCPELENLAFSSVFMGISQFTAALHKLPPILKKLSISSWFYTNACKIENKLLEPKVESKNRCEEDKKTLADCKLSVPSSSLSFKHLKCLEEVCLPNSELPYNFMVALATTLPYTLTRLTLRSCSLTDDDFQPFIQAFHEGSFPFLEKLDISFNQLTSKTMEGLSFWIGENPRLRHLLISGNDLATQGSQDWVLKMRDSLLQNDHLRKLDMAGIEVGIPGVKAVIDLLMSVHNLKLLTFNVLIQCNDNMTEWEETLNQLTTAYEKNFLLQNLQVKVGFMDPVWFQDFNRKDRELNAQIRKILLKEPLEKSEVKTEEMKREVVPGVQKDVDHEPVSSTLSGTSTSPGNVSLVDSSKTDSQLRFNENAMEDAESDDQMKQQKVNLFIDESREFALANNYSLMYTNKNLYIYSKEAESVPVKHKETLKWNDVLELREIIIFGERNIKFWSPENQTILVNLVKSCRRLEHFNLQAFPNTHDIFADLLINLPETLETLTLKDVVITKGWPRLHFPYLTSLSLSSSSLNCDDLALIASGTFNNLKSFTVEGNLPEDVENTVITELINRATSLDQLYLKEPIMYESTARLIGAWLKANPKLQYLFIKSIFKMPLEALKSLSDGLVTNYNVKHLAILSGYNLEFLEEMTKLFRRSDISLEFFTCKILIPQKSKKEAPVMLDELLEARATHLHPEWRVNVYMDQPEWYTQWQKDFRVVSRNKRV